MSKDSYYIKLDVNAPEDTKVKILRKHHGNMEGFGSYIFIALKLRQEENCYLEYNDFTFEALGIDMGKTPEEVKQFIDDCIKFKLFKKDETHFWSGRVNRDKAILDEKREQMRKAGEISAKKRWGKSIRQISKPSMTSAPPKVTEGIAKMIELYEQKTGRAMTPNDLERLKDIADNYDNKDFEKALDEAVLKKARSPMPYIAKMLENWKQEKQPKQPVRRTYNDGNMVGMKIE